MTLLEPAISFYVLLLGVRSKHHTAIPLQKSDAEQIEQKSAATKSLEFEFCVV